MESEIFPLIGSLLESYKWFARMKSKRFILDDAREMDYVGFLRKYTEYALASRPDQTT